MKSCSGVSWIFRTGTIWRPWANAPNALPMIRPCWLTRKEWGGIYQSQGPGCDHLKIQCRPTLINRKVTFWLDGDLAKVGQKLKNKSFLNILTLYSQEVFKYYKYSDQSRALTRVHCTLYSIQNWQESQNVRWSSKRVSVSCEMMLVLSFWLI